MKVVILYTLTSLKESWWHEVFMTQSCSNILWFSSTNKAEMRQYAWPPEHLLNELDIWWCTDTDQSFDCFNLYIFKIRRHICNCRKFWWWCSQCRGYTFLRKTSFQPCRLRHSVLIIFQHEYSDEATIACIYISLSLVNFQSLVLGRGYLVNASPVRWLQQRTWKTL